MHDRACSYLLYILPLRYRYSNYLKLMRMKTYCMDTTIILELSYNPSLDFGYGQILNSTESILVNVNASRILFRLLQFFHYLG